MYLTQSEMDEWFDLTGKIKQNAWRSEDGKPDEHLSKLLRDRRALLETASGKIAMLNALLEEEDAGTLRHTLVYTSDKGPDQLYNVNRLLRYRNILFSPAYCGRKRRAATRTKRILRSFQEGEIRILTAKRVLDEGVNIPQICKGVSSLRVRRSNDNGCSGGAVYCALAAPSARRTVIIHDLLALPPGMEEGLDPDARGLVRSELRRAQEFARLARNAGRPAGAAGDDRQNG